MRGSIRSASRQRTLNDIGQQAAALTAQNWRPGLPSTGVEPDPYILLTQVLTNAGLAAQRNLPDELIVSAQESSATPSRGTGLCLSYQAGCWYLSTWLPAHCRVPSGCDMVALCRACLEVGSSVNYRVPPEVMTRFGLQEIDARQYEELFPTEGEND